MSTSDNPMLTAALAFAERGWPVFPCRARDEIRTLPNGEPVLDTRTGAPIVDKAKAPLTSKGLKDATTDPERIRWWWNKWPDAAIGAPQGVNGLFVLDFDPRHDAVTGEVFELEQLKAELEAQMGCPLPVSATSITPSGGVHVFLAQPDDGAAPIRNRGNLPRHVDVRGSGGYVILPPSRLPGYGNEVYRWHRPLDTTPPAAPPARLVEILRAPKAAPPSRPREDAPARPDAGEAVRKYALSALDAELRVLADTPPGGRNNQINASAFALGQLVGAGALSRGTVRAALEDVVSAWPDVAKSLATIESGLNAGIAQPRDLSDVATRGQPARSRGRSAAALPARERSPATTSPAAASSTSSEPDPASPRPDPSSSAAYPPTPPSEKEADRSSHGGSEAGEAAEEGFGADDHAACARLPMTDLGNAERFLHRLGNAFRYCEEHGWLAWTGTHWRVLADDMSDKKRAPAEVQLAVYRVIRAIGDEADWLAAAGVEWRAERGLPNDPEAESEIIRRWEYDPDPVVDIVKSRIVRQSDRLRKWAAGSESAQRLGAVATLAKPKLTVPAEQFDAHPLKINVQNGTLTIEQLLPESTDWAAILRPHDRNDYITKVSPASYDTQAKSPLYDALLEWAQPKPDMRRFIHAWGGLSLTALPVQLLVQHYGLGGNGKGTVIEAHAYVAGDYAASIGIETILDTGQARDPSKASPDLAKLPGVRMLRTSEPKQGAKLDEALVKRLTGGDPIDARHLNRGFFTYKPVFKLSAQGNYRLQIIGTDNGIWRRVRLVPWSQQIDKDQMDEDLPKKLEGEADGILLNLVEGLLDYMRNGLVEPDDIKAATADYRADSDPLGRFLEDATLPSPEGKVSATALHASYAAWAKLAGEGDWSPKYLSKKMKDRGFEATKASTMFWVGLKLIKAAEFYNDDPDMPGRAPAPDPDDYGRM